MLRRSLAGIVSADQFEAAEVSPAARPETLGVDAWVRLTHAVTSTTPDDADPS
jgi:16S rRNA (adenine1518-N6/adenine1519-N6)-dimethyltransferase